LYSTAVYAEKDWSRVRYPDWYLANMYVGLKKYYAKTWGADFQRDDFIPLFTANNFNAKEIVGLAKQCGAKYFIPFNKHHDGYCLWDSKFTQRDAVDMFPHRDLTAEMVSECKKNNLYHGFYFSVEDYEYPLIDESGNLKLRLRSKSIAPDNAGQVGKAGDISIDFDPKFHNKVVSDYLAPQGKDFIDKYDPDILWFDGEWQRPAEYYKTPDLVAYFYNRAEGKKTVVANDRMGFGTREHHGDFYTSETDEVTKPMDFTWEENRSMSESYGFSWDDSLSRYMKPEQLIQMLVRIVAKGGNLNLIVNADGTGKIPDT
jgi:alpha-L-fucosidase